MKEILTSPFHRFLLVGVLNTAFGYLIYAFLIYLGIGHIISATVSFLIGIIFNFYTHGRFVFRAKSISGFPLYVASWLVLYLVNIGILDLLVNKGVNRYIAGALMVPPMAVLAFVVLKFIVFKPQVNGDKYFHH